MTMSTAYWRPNRDLLRPNEKPKFLIARFYFCIESEATSQNFTRVTSGNIWYYKPWLNRPMKILFSSDWLPSNSKFSLTFAQNLQSETD